jgi:hypothetical protein
MTKKSAKSTVKPTVPVKQTPSLQVLQGPDDTKEQAIARTAISPTAHAAATVYRYSPLSNVDGFELPALQAEVGKQVRAVMDGDMSR